MQESVRARCTRASHSARASAHTRKWLCECACECTCRKACGLARAVGGACQYVRAVQVRVRVRVRESVRARACRATAGPDSPWCRETPCITWLCGQWKRVSGGRDVSFKLRENGTNGFGAETQPQPQINFKIKTQPKNAKRFVVSVLSRERKHPETPNPFNTMNTRSIQ